MKSVAEYGAVVLGAPLYIFRWHKDARGFLSRHQKALLQRPVAVFAVGPINDKEEDWQAIRENFQKELAKFRWFSPLTTEVFGGKFNPNTLTFPHNLIPAMKQMPPSDIRDWAAIREWSEGLNSPIPAGGWRVKLTRRGRIPRIGFTIAETSTGDINVKNATKATILTFAAITAIAGSEHGIGEILQGSHPPDELYIQSWPGSPFFEIMAGEPAMTVVPNLLVTGLLAILASLIFLGWAGFFIGRRHAGLVLILLSIGMLLVGAGFRAAPAGDHPRRRRDMAANTAEDDSKARRRAAAFPGRSVGVGLRRRAGRLAAGLPRHQPDRCLHRHP